MSHAFGRGFLDTLTQHPPTGHQLRPPTGPYNPPFQRPVGGCWTLENRSLLHHAFRLDMFNPGVRGSIQSVWAVSKHCSVNMALFNAYYSKAYHPFKAA